MALTITSGFLASLGLAALAANTYCTMPRPEEAAAARVVQRVMRGSIALRAVGELIFIIDVLSIVLLCVALHVVFMCVALHVVLLVALPVIAIR
jgi:hypothetical protein